MKTKNLILDHSRKRQEHEDISKHFPHRFSPILFHALFIKPIQFIDLPVFMVPPKNSNATTMLNFENQHVEKCLNAVETPINIITHEQKVSVLSKRSNTGSLPQI